MSWLHGWLPQGWTIKQMKYQHFLLLWCNSWFWGQAIEWMVLQLERNKNCLRDIPLKDQYKLNQSLATKMFHELFNVRIITQILVIKFWLCLYRDFLSCASYQMINQSNLEDRKVRHLDYKYLLFFLGPKICLFYYFQHDLSGIILYQWSQYSESSALRIGIPLPSAFYFWMPLIECPRLWQITMIY